MFKLFSPIVGKHVVSRRGPSSLSWSLAPLAGVALSACASPAPAPEDSTSGGTKSSGGSVASGGSTSNGGAIIYGGAMSSGGSVASGGAPSSGGSIASGGAPSSGGSVASGGSAGFTNNGGGANGGGAGAAGKGGAGGTAGGGGATSCPGFVLCDDFQDGNITANPMWTATPSAFTVVTDGDSMVLKEAPMEAWAYVISATWTDMTVQARVKILDFGGTSSSNCAGLIARFQGSSEPFYQVALCAKGDVGVYKDGGLVDDVNGVKASNIVAAKWYSVKMKVAGAPGNVGITVWIDDTQTFAIKDTDTSAPVASGFAALGSKKSIGVEYDDFRVSTP